MQSGVALDTVAKIKTHVDFPIFFQHICLRDGHDWGKRCACQTIWPVLPDLGSFSQVKNVSLTMVDSSDTTNQHSIDLSVFRLHGRIGLIKFYMPQCKYVFVQIVSVQTLFGLATRHRTQCVQMPLHVLNCKCKRWRSYQIYLEEPVVASFQMYLYKNSLNNTHCGAEIVVPSF